MDGNGPAWISKISDASRADYVAEHGSKLNPRSKTPKRATALDKIVDAERVGFAQEQGPGR